MNFTVINISLCDEIVNIFILFLCKKERKRKKERKKKERKKEKTQAVSEL
jgi:hypothetical protein